MKSVEAVAGWRNVRRPLAFAGAAVVAVAVLHFRDPHAHAAYGLCPFHEVTGWWCPGCGGLRAVNDLTNGDLVGSLHSNVLLLPLVLVATLAWVRWVVLRSKGSTARIALGRTAVIVLPTLVVAFTVFRNTPMGHWLAPT